MAQGESDYELRRLKNIEDNKRVLAELGLLNPYMKLCIRKKHSEPIKTLKPVKKTKRPLCDTSPPSIEATLAEESQHAFEALL
ncbi:hypothetical protein EB796_010773 [Bugula neritina]|uniref:Uncharacterized protein n=1 Tax=Bugula neritina TaxID=10212 RepID=A0A7J7JY73_BUGNE|nr:hypothetical protein EB796_010773 [Bugula neritina]